MSIELLDQRVDTRLIEPQRLHLDDDLFLELLVLTLLRQRQQLVVQLVVEVLVLQSAQALERIGDLVEGLQHLGLELGLYGRERHRVLEIVLVQVAFAERAFLGLLLAVAAVQRLGLERRRGRWGRRRSHRLRRNDREERGRPRGRGRRRIDARHGSRYRLGVGPGIGRFEIDDVAQEHFAVVQFVAPDDDGLEGERALAQPGDHRLAAGLNTLGGGDLALAREQPNRAHLAKIHAHRVVGALDRLLGLGFGRRLRRDLDQLAGLGFLALGLLARLLLFRLGLLGLNHVDAHFVECRQNVFNLLRGDLLRGYDRIELLVGDVAALRGLLDHLRDGGVRKIEQRQRGIPGRGTLLSASSFCGVALVLCVISLSTPSAEPAPGHGLSHMPPTAASRPMVGCLSLVHPRKRH